MKEYTEREGGKKLTSVCGYWERVLTVKEKLEKHSLKNEDKELLTQAWKEFNVSWQTMTLDPWEKANEARKRWLFWKLKIYRWWWNPRGCWKVLPKGYKRSKGGQFFPSVSFLGNYKLYILVKHKREKGAQLGADYLPKDSGEGARASWHGSRRRRNTGLLITSTSFNSWGLSASPSCYNAYEAQELTFHFSTGREVQNHSVCRFSVQWGPASWLTNGRLFMCPLMAGRGQGTRGAQSLGPTLMT